MNILIAGWFQYPWYEEACARALEGLGCYVERFSWKPWLASGLGRIEDYLTFAGPSARAMAGALTKRLRAAHFDLVLIWRGTLIPPATLHRLKSAAPTAVFASYNNDDPFNSAYGNSTNIHQRRLWRYFVRSISAYDVNFVYRPINVVEYDQHGSPATLVLPPYYVPEMHRPVQLSPAERALYGCDVVFIGHHEDDGRVEMLRALVQAGIQLKIFGMNWPQEAVRSIFGCGERVRPVLGDEYAKALCGAKIALSFLSKLNRDAYTRRSFEIPACGVVMVSESTPELAQWFKPWEEAVFFRSKEELLGAVRRLLGDDALRRRVAEQGRKRCLTDGHDVTGRMKQMLAHIDRIRSGMDRRT